MQGLGFRVLTAFVGWVVVISMMGLGGFGCGVQGLGFRVADGGRVTGQLTNTPSWKSRIDEAHKRAL